MVSHVVSVSHFLGFLRPPDLSNHIFLPVYLPQLGDWNEPRVGFAFSLLTELVVELSCGETERMLSWMELCLSSTGFVLQHVPRDCLRFACSMGLRPSAANGVGVLFTL